jgi:hypothetical protein
LFHESTKAVTGQGGYRYNLGKRKELLELVYDGKDIFLPDKVDLIDKQYNRQPDVPEGFNN